MHLLPYKTPNCHSIKYRVSHIARIEDGEKFLDTPLFAHEQKHYVILCGVAYFQSILWTVVTTALANCERWESFPASEHAIRLRARAGPPRPSTMAPSPAPAPLPPTPGSWTSRTQTWTCGRHRLRQHHLRRCLRACLKLWATSRRYYVLYLVAAQSVYTLVSETRV